MKSNFIRLLITISLMTFFTLCSKDKSVTGDGGETGGKYIDGSYAGQTQIDHEGYNALASVKVSQHRITDVEWRIYDNNLKRIFDDTYEEVFAGNEVYMQQCRDNRSGMAVFGPRLIETQELDSVDNITGATWSYRKFRDVMQTTLKDACQDTTADQE